MRYEDASHAFQGQGPVANDDADQVAAGAKSTATGNVISGEGTQTGAVGADSAAGAHITAIAGKGGEDTSFAGGKLSVMGEYGKLSVDAEGNYVYQANKGVENVRDRFTYTLADNNGASDTAALIIEIGKTPFAIKADAQQIVPGPDGVVTLPPGVELSDVHVVGRNLVIDMPDGTQLVIIDGAVFVPQLVVNGVEVPATNVAALLIGQEVAPAAGELPPSSGGNFAVPPPPLDPGVPLGDLIPPTEYTYQPPEPQPPLDIQDSEPEIFIQPDGQPAAVNAVDSVDEKGLPTRNGGEPEGSGEEAAAGADGDPSEATGGTILIDSPDGVDSVTINGVLVTGVIGQQIAGAFGTLTITGFDGDNILYSYVLNDNTSGNDTHDDFSVTLTDSDGDQATATLVIDIVDDVPTARPDTDALGIGETVAKGNVITDALPDDAGDSDNGRDTVGADNATITAVSSANVPGNADTDPGANFQIAGQYGVLVLNTDGSYTYTRNPDAPGGVQDVFNYTITDGDGDTSSTTLTITIPDQFPDLPDPDLIRLDDDVIPGANGNPDGPNDDVPDAPDDNVVSGQLSGTGGDGTLTYNFTGTNSLPLGQGFSIDPASDDDTLIIVQDQNGSDVVVLTIQLDQSDGSFTVTQDNPILHPDGNTENNLEFQIGVEVEDSDGDTDPATITINVDDDTPTATVTQLTGTVDEDGVLEGAADNGPGDGIADGTGDVAGQVVSATGNVSTLFSIGADGLGSYSLTNNFAALIAQNLTSGGVALSYSVGFAAGVYTLTATAGPGGDTVFTFTLNATTGAYNFTLVDQLDHATLDGLVGDNTENDLSVNLSSIIQVTDADGDSVSAGANGLVITVDDDTPIATNVQLTGTVDEDGVVENGAVGIQYGDGIPGGTGDVAGEVVSATGNVSTLFQSGADEALTYQLLGNFAGLNAQNLTSGGVALTYSVQLAAGVYTLTATAGNGGPVVFTFTLNATTGAYNFTLVDQLDHLTLNGLTGDNTENDLAINLSSIIQATDHDGDSVAAGSNGLIITVDDDSPVINTVTDAQIDNDATPSGGGTFDFDIGADENSDHDDITVSNFTVLVNGQPVTESLIAGPETATTASYTFSFDYDTGTGGTATATGTLVFDKVAGTYTVELTSGPIEGFSLLSTGAADASDFVSYQVPDGGSGSPEVTVAQLDTDFFVQFSSFAEPGAGTGTDNLTTTQGAGGTFTPTTGTFAGLELFTQTMSTVQVSSTAAGVAGNTIQGGEVLDLNLYSTNPMGTLGGVPDQSSTSMFMVLDGIGTSEDMIVVLKLLDTSTGEYTTKAIIVQNGDILTDADAASLVGTAYEGLGAALDNNDGLIVIEASDYQEGNTNLVIVGAQIAGSDEGIIGTGIDLNGAVDSDTVDGSSSGTQAFSTDTSDAPFKITSIGFLTTSTEDQTASIDFDVTVEDADGDAVTQHITVDIGTSSPALLPPAPESSSTTLSTESLLAYDSGTNEQLQKTATNSNTLTLSAAIAAAGLVEEPVAASLPDDSSHGQDVSEVAASVGPAVQDIADGAGEESGSALGDEAHEAADDVKQTASSGHSEPAAVNHSLDDSHVSAPANSNDAPANDDQGPAAASADASPAAQSVAMVSAEALQAAGLDGNAQHGGAVEKIIAEALGHGNGHGAVDALLNAIHGENGGEQAIANLATAHGNAVSAWDMASNGGSAGNLEMLMKVGAEMLHHDMVQPTHNG